MPILDWFIQQNPQHQSYNITPDASISLYELATMVKTISNKDLPIHVALDGMGSEYSGDNTLLRKEFPKVEFTPIYTAIENLYNWYKERKDSINKEFLLTDK